MPQHFDLLHRHTHRFAPITNCFSLSTTGSPSLLPKCCDARLQVLIGLGFDHSYMGTIVVFL